MFALLMEEVIQRQGEAGLAEMKALAQDPSAQVPEEVQKKAKKTMQKALAARERKPARQVTWKLLQRIAVAILAAALLAAGTFAAFPEVRSNVYHLIVREYQDHTEFDFTQQPDTGNEEGAE